MINSGSLSLRSRLSPLEMHSIPSTSSDPYKRFPDFDDLLTTTWSLIEQTPPPSLREILGAYNSRGDGDRDMLLALLNAKSAEDQRIASMATLHHKLLQLHDQPSPLPPHRPKLFTPSNPFPYSPPDPRRSPHLSPRSTQPSARNQHTVSSTSLPPRKRHRTASRSPPSRAAPPPSSSSTHDYDHDSTSTLPLPSHDLPPSPHSRSSSNDSAECSPRTRQSMTIGSLLSSRHGQEGDDGGHNANGAPQSGDRQHNLR